MTYLDRLADRMMAALPNSRAGTIAFTSLAAGVLVGACCWWLGPLPTVLILLASAGLAARWLWRQAGPWRPW